MTDTQPDSSKPLRGPVAADGLITYYGHVKADNLTTWAVSAMKNSYSPYSGRKEGVLIRTERGDINVGTNVETINWDGLTAIEIAIGRLFVQQPWIDHQSMPEKISDIIFALEDFDAANPDSFVPSGRSLDWLRKFGSPETVLHFCKPDGLIHAAYRLHNILPHGPKMKPLRDYFEKTKLFSGVLAEHQDKPEDVDGRVWHGLRHARLHAFAPYSTYRVGVVVEAEPLPLSKDQRAELHKAFSAAKLEPQTQDLLLSQIIDRRSRFQGMNVELSGNESLHAEGCAIGAMITDLGPQAKIGRINLQGGFEHGAADCHYCGKCRQLIDEFATATTITRVVSETEIVSEMENRALLPGAFAKLG